MAAIKDINPAAGPDPETQLKAGMADNANPGLEGGIPEGTQPPEGQVQPDISPKQAADKPAEDLFSKFQAAPAAPPEDLFSKFQAAPGPSIDPSPQAFEDRVNQGKAVVSGWEKELKEWSGKQLFSGDTYHAMAGGLGVLGAAADHARHRGIEAEALGVVDIFIACQAAVDRLPQQRRQGVLGVLPGPRILQAARGRAGQPEGVIEFPIGEESGVTGDGGPVKLQFDFAVEIDADGVVLAVTHWVPRSFRQEVVGNAGFSEEKAQTPCRNDRVIWEIRGKASCSVA